MAKTEPRNAPHRDTALPPSVGARAPDFLVPTRSGPKSLSVLAREVKTLALVTMDSYRFHRSCSGSLMASLRQGYPALRAAAAEVVMISPDPLEYHHRYGQLLFGEELPWLVVSDPTCDIARRYGALRSDEHDHGGFWRRSLWIVSRDAVIMHRALPWKVGGEVTAELEAAFKQLFTWTGAEGGEFVSSCSPGSDANVALKAWLGSHSPADRETVLK